MEQLKILEELIHLFNESATAYREYLEGGKTFKYAKELKRINGNALQLIRNHRSGVNEELRNDLDQLITHYAEWSSKWEKLASEKEFNSEDVFVFANEITFPKQGAIRIQDYYNELRQGAAAQKR